MLLNIGSTRVQDVEVTIVGSVTIFDKPYVSKQDLRLLNLFSGSVFTSPNIIMLSKRLTTYGNKVSKAAIYCVKFSAAGF